ncbi:hypothetical protein KDA00_01825 [Candidatus Saccharibacteria bacterium]|nr:hypothetical protein [Candidatus Saccharibacteria bacterium]
MFKTRVSSAETEGGEIIRPRFGRILRAAALCGAILLGSCSSRSENVDQQSLPVEDISTEPSNSNNVKHQDYEQSTTVESSTDKDKISVIDNMLLAVDLCAADSSNPRTEYIDPIVDFLENEDGPDAWPTELSSSLLLKLQDSPSELMANDYSCTINGINSHIGFTYNELTGDVIFMGTLSDCGYEYDQSFQEANSYAIGLSEEPVVYAFPCSNPSGIPTLLSN